jgi:hypothetical protein
MDSCLYFYELSLVWSLVDLMALALLPIQTAQLTKLGHQAAQAQHLESFAKCSLIFSWFYYFVGLGFVF